AGGGDSAGLLQADRVLSGPARRTVRFEKRPERATRSLSQPPATGRGVAAEAGSVARGRRRADDDSQFQLQCAERRNSCALSDWSSDTLRVLPPIQQGGFS